MRRTAPHVAGLTGSLTVSLNPVGMTGPVTTYNKSYNKNIYTYISHITIITQLGRSGQVLLGSARTDRASFECALFVIPRQVLSLQRLFGSTAHTSSARKGIPYRWDEDWLKIPVYKCMVMRRRRSKHTHSIA